MWELDYKESWALKNWCFWTVVLEKTLESSLYGRSSNQSMLKEISPDYSLEGLMLKLKLPTLATWCEELTHWKDPTAGKDWRQEDKGTTEDESWLASLTGWTWVWASSGSCWWTGNLACCSTWGHKELDMTEWLNWTELKDLMYNMVTIYFIVNLKSPEAVGIICS